jgi:hypothetical protein
MTLKKLFSLILILGVSTIAALGISNQVVHAGGTSGGGGGGGDSGCRWGYNSTCYGAFWQWHSSSKTYWPRYGTQEAVYTDKCAAMGVDGYWVLALLDAGTGTYQVSPKPVGYIERNNGAKRDMPGANMNEPFYDGKWGTWSGIKALYDAQAARGEVATSWYDTTYFCSQAVSSVPPQVFPPAPKSGGTSTTSVVNNVATLNNYDYKNQKLTYSHIVNVGTYLPAVNPSSARTHRNNQKIEPPEEAGTAYGQIANNSWSVGNVSGNSSGLGVAAAKGAVASPNQNKVVYSQVSKTLTGNNVGKNLCQSISAAPSWAKRETINKYRSGYLVGWDVKSSSGGTASSTACANVISNWIVNPSSAISQTRAKPDDNIVIAHSLQNNDHVVKDDNGNWVYPVATVKHGELNSANNVVDTNIPFAGPTNSFQFNSQEGESKRISVNNSFTVTTDGPEVGKTYCQYPILDKPWRNSTGPIKGGAVCVYIPYNYTTILDVTGVTNANIEAGDVLNIGQTLLVDKINGTNPTGYYKTKTPSLTVQVVCTTNGVAGCSGWNPVTITDNYPSYKTGSIGGSVNWQAPVDSPAGTKYCFQAKAIVNGQMISGVPGTTESAQNCVVIVKSPTLQIHGADSWSGVNCDATNTTLAGGFDAKPINLIDPAHGGPALSATWSQYGLFSSGPIAHQFGSGGQIYNVRDFHPSGLHYLRRANRLKFAGDTTDISGYYQSPGNRHCLTDMLSYHKQRFFSTEDPYDINLNEILNGNRPSSNVNGKTTWWGDGDKTLNATGVDLNNKNLTLITNGDITINSDLIIYNNTFADISGLPNLTIIATGNIIIGPNVTRLDAILAAGNTFYDCGDKSTLGTDGVSADFALTGACQNPLTVNGAIIAESTRFHRTYRGNNSQNDNVFNPTPAETIHYPSAIWLQNHAYQTSLSGSIPVTFYREVAPRV